jgi:hypothetical protein
MTAGLREACAFGVGCHAVLAVVQFVDGEPALAAVCGLCVLWLGLPLLWKR